MSDLFGNHIVGFPTRWYSEARYNKVELYFTLLISKMYLMRVLSFVGDVRFNIRGEHVPGCLGRG